MIGLIFPHQLFENHQRWQDCEMLYLIEEYLFFKQYNFHKQKLVYHRASMKFYEEYLKGHDHTVKYINCFEAESDIRIFLDRIDADGITYIDTVDHWLEKRILEGTQKRHISLKKLQNPSFLNTEAELETYFRHKKRLFQTDFYKQERIKRKVLIEPDQSPTGGQWSFDAENRKKYPKGKQPPSIEKLPSNEFFEEAKAYVSEHFGQNYGQISEWPLYPNTLVDSQLWLETFLQTRFADFGIYEDAIVAQEAILHHSVLTPMLNTGLLTPQYVIETTLDFAQKNDIPLNSLEGFIRQIIGWREFIRMVYIAKGTEERTRNYWQFTRKIPESFWKGTTGIAPIDSTIKKVLQTGYCHHIERLMVLGNFMLLCEFDPDDVYRWFMELFIDAYDWVMVPNVYGMSQFADGGLMATKPYISGSNYLMKMSDYPKGAWQTTWDALFWRFMHFHRDFFLKNPRLSMLIHTFDKWDEDKKHATMALAEAYLKSLD